MALRDYIEVVRRRKWIVVPTMVLVPLIAVVWSLSQEPVYEGSAKVLLSRQNLANALTGVEDPNASVEDQTLVETQADVARVPEVAERVLSQLGEADMTAADFLNDSSVSTGTDTEILTFQVRSGDRGFASQAATEYATQYTRYRHEVDGASLESARRAVTSRLEELRAAGEDDGTLYASLLRREEELRTMRTLQTANATVIQAADGADQVSPQPVRNGAIGLVLGAVLGLGVAFLREALDTRVRGSEEVSERLGLPLLARVPELPRKLRGEDTLVTLAEPTGIHAEAFRMLRTNVEFAMVDREVRSLVITSALPEEGKSTVAANLALAFARAGQHVALVDLDLRKPRLERLFNLRGKPGLTQVVLKRAGLDAALAQVPILPGELAGQSAELDPSGLPAAHVNGGGGRLEVLTSGPIPPNPGEFVASHRLTGVLEELCERADLVLVDSPPFLQVGDAMTLSANVDALLVVTRLKILRRGIVIELHRLLETARAHKLGFVVNAAESEGGYGYGYAYAYGPSHATRPHQPEGEAERVA